MRRIKGEVKSKKGEVKSGGKAKIICRDDPLERLLSIYQSPARQGFLHIPKNIFAEKHGVLSLRDRVSFISRRAKTLIFKFLESTFHGHHHINGGSTDP